MGGSCTYLSFIIYVNTCKYNMTFSCLFECNFGVQPTLYKHTKNTIFPRHSPQSVAQAHCLSRLSNNYQILKTGVQNTEENAGDMVCYSSGSRVIGRIVKDLISSPAPPLEQPSAGS